MNLRTVAGLAGPAFFSCILLGCGQVEPGSQDSLNTLNHSTFVSAIQPVFDSRGCANSGCHYRDKNDPNNGGPGGSLRLFDCSGNSCTDDELMANHDSAYGMANLSTPAASKLLTKPLAESAGGIQHLGGDIFLSTADPDYQTLLGWIQAPSSTP